MNIMSLPRVGPFVGVSRDVIVKPEGAGIELRVLVYGAYDAFGLIGSECNGIAILDETNKEVLVDEVSREGTGYCGPSKAQLDEFDRITKTLTWDEIRTIINNSERARMEV